MSREQRTEIRAYRKPWLCDSIEISLARITTVDGQRSVAVAENMQMRTLTADRVGEEIPALMALRPEEAQQFMDELWRAGIRPTEGAGSVGQLSAVQAHLEDMRTLVFKK